MPSAKKRTPKALSKTSVKPRTPKKVLVQAGPSKPALALIVVGLLVVLGFVWVLLTRAATNEKLSLEAEQATTKTGATTVPDATASGGQAVQLTNGAAAATYPAANSYQVCGNTSLLSGPTTAPTAPAGFTVYTINPGTDLSQQPRRDNAIYYLTAGVHTISGRINTGNNNQYIGAPGAILDGQNKAQSDGKYIAFTGGYSNVTIKYLTIRNFGQADGRTISMVNITPINYSQGQGWHVENNWIHHNGGAGIYAATGNVVRNNCVEYNDQNGVAVPKQGTTPVTDVLIENNEIRNNNPGNLEGASGACTGCTSGIKTWNSRRVTIRNNNVSNNYGSGIWPDTNNTDTMIEGNVVKDNTKRGIFVEISYNTVIRNNYIKGNFVAQKGNTPEGGIYISESGGNAAAAAAQGGKFDPVIDIYGNYIVDNWNGVDISEDAGRMCQYSGATSSHNPTNDCPPMVTSPSTQCPSDNTAASNATLTQNAIICRWRSENVKVHNNTFEMTSAATWCSATATNCGRNAIHAFQTSYPIIGPYTLSGIQTAISKNQGNSFYNNTYYGSWKFAIPTGGTTALTPAVWQSTWGQDVNSTFATAPTAVQCGAETANASEIGYKSLNLAGGTYNVWARVKKGAANGRIRVGVDANMTCADLAPNTSVTDWQWVTGGTVTSSVFQLIAGTHSLRFIALDPGVQIDKVLILDSGTTCTPTGDGSNCTATTTTTTTTTTTSVPTPDTAAPVGPSSLSASAVSSSQINLAWPAATDNVGVTQYVVTRNGTQVYAGTNLSFSDIGLTASTTYQYKVIAKDAAGNTSTGATASATTQAAPTTTITPTTPPPPPTDIILPTAPTNVKGVINWDATRFAYYTYLTWSASTDNVGVSSYEVKRNGATLGTSTKTSFADYNIQANTPYTYEVYARDAAGNTSTAGTARLVGRCFLIWCWAE